MVVDEKMKEFATERQAEFLEAYLEHGSYRAAARALGCDESQVRKGLKRLKKVSAKRGYSPEHGYTHPVPDGYTIKGVSQLFGEDGKVKSQWVKSQVDKQKSLALFQEAFAGFAAQYEGYSKIPLETPTEADEDLLCVYIMGDPHFGMFSWHEETGEDYDLKIASEYHRDAISRLVRVSPPAKNAILLNLGDFFHTDSKANVTAASGHQLDVDSRYVKILQVGIDAQIAYAEMVAQKHENVTVVNLAGNHDEQSALAMSLVMRSFYKNNPRVDIYIPNDVFFFRRFGKCLIGSTHSHKAAPRLLEVVTSDHRKDWGETEYSRMYCGHIHHEKVETKGGLIVEWFPTLASRDSYAHNEGFRSERSMRCDVWHKEYGRENYNVVGIKRVREPK